MRAPSRDWGSGPRLYLQKVPLAERREREIVAASAREGGGGAVPGRRTEASKQVDKRASIHEKNERSFYFFGADRSDLSSVHLIRDS